MRTECWLAAIVFFLSACSWAGCADLPQGQVTVKVVGEDGNPVVGASVGVGFFNPLAKTKETPVDGITNTAGLFIATGTTDGVGGFRVDKDGYYRSTGHFGFADVQNGRWQPWNPTLTVVLKKIVHPVPMYAKQAEIEIPAEKTPIGYDLMEGDWVAPYGKGRISDFLFRLTRRFVSRRDYDAALQLSFSNEGDGIKEVFAPSPLQGGGSWLSLPRHAPAESYEARWERTDSYRQSAQTRDDQNYFFRVRTQLTDGKPRKALYGKIHGEIRFWVIDSKTALIRFTYYLNPDGTQNVEFDPKRNLFKNLKSLEEVHQP